MILYYPISENGNTEYDCSGTEEVNDGGRTNFPSSFDSLKTRINRTIVPVSVYHTFTGSSTITTNRPFDLPEEFTISFWIKRDTPITRTEYIFRSIDNTFSIFLDTNSRINVSHSSGPSAQKLITLNRWTFITIRQGTVKFSSQDKKVLFIETTTMPDDLDIISPILSSSLGGTGFPSIIKNVENLQLTLNEAMTLPEIATLPNQLPKTYKLLELFSGVLAEFRIWDRILTTEEMGMIKSSPFILDTGDSSKFSVEDIREVEAITGYTSTDFIHSKSVSSLSSHMENILTDSFDMEVYNESYEPILANTSRFIAFGSNNYYDTGKLVNKSSGNTSLPYVHQEVLEEGKTYFVKATVSVSNNDCIGVGLFTNISEKIISSVPTINSDCEACAILVGNSNNRVSIYHEYNDFVSNREMTIKEILIVNLTDSGIDNLLEEFGITEVEDKTKWCESTFSSPVLSSEYKANKLVSVSLKPAGSAHNISRRKKYTIENIAFDKFASFTQKTGTSPATLQALNFDTSDLLLYASVVVNNITSSNITVKMVAKNGTSILSDGESGWIDEKTITPNATVTLSILIKEGWGKNLTNTNRITSIELLSGSNFQYKDFIFCDLTSNDVEYWLDTMNFETVVSYPINRRVVNTLEKKTLWCDKFLKPDDFNNNNIVEYTMLSPYYVLESETSKFSGTTNNAEYYDKLDDLTNGTNNEYILENDIPNPSLVHMFGNSSNPFGGTPLKGIGVFADTISEIKDI